MFCNKNMFFNFHILKTTVKTDANGSLQFFLVETNNFYERKNRRFYVKNVELFEIYDLNHKNILYRLNSVRWHKIIDQSNFNNSVPFFRMSSTILLFFC